MSKPQSHDPERQPLRSTTSVRAFLSEHSPPLPLDAHHVSAVQASSGDADDADRDGPAAQSLNNRGEESWLWRLRSKLQKFFASKWSHYFVLLLVSVDISAIFADFLISLHVCEHDGQKGFDKRVWLRVDDVLDHVSLAISCLFLAELVGSIFAFGFSYFKSKFHIFDASVIVAGFLIDVILRGQIEEAGSLIVAGRLWRVFKIIEEFSTGADDELEALQEKVESLKVEKRHVMTENDRLRRRVTDMEHHLESSNTTGLWSHSSS